MRAEKQSTPILFKATPPLQWKKTKQKVAKQQIITSHL